MIYNDLYGGKMQDIKILDCTLRDGGYLNNWTFSDNSNVAIENNLYKSKIDFVEAGFLTNKQILPESTTLYNTPQKVENKIVMVNFGEYNLSELLCPVEIRLAFKQPSLNLLKDNLKILSEREIKFSLNPMHISLYSKEDLKKLFDITNEFKPTCLTAVDTMGIMTQDDTKKIFKEFDKNLDIDIHIGFHSHDNLNLSMNNIKELLSLDLDRIIILDSCLNGIGRGGGMLSTNELAKFLNIHYGKKYDTDLINNTSKKYIQGIANYDKMPYYLTAKQKCHPNYGLYLSNHNCSNKEIEYLLSFIPDEKKQNYDEETISNIIKVERKLIY